MSLLRVGLTLPWPQLAPQLPRTLPKIAVALPFPSLPSLLSGLADGLWLAAPKQRLSYAKKRTRQLDAQKALKFATNLLRCPACGRVRRLHTMCMYCFHGIRTMLKRDVKKDEFLKPELVPERDRALLYPGKRMTEYEFNLKALKDEYIPRRGEALQYDKISPKKRRGYE